MSDEPVGVVVFDRPSKDNGRLWMCVKCSFYGVDFTTPDPGQMYDHMQRHYRWKHSVPGGVFTQLEEAIREKLEPEMLRADAALAQDDDLTDG